MKKLILVVFLFAAMGSIETQAQYRESGPVWGSVENDNSVYRDDRGEYRWEVRERRVWVPEYRTRGILGVGGRTIPGHYEMRRVREKVYLGGSGRNGKQHPHGMPPGQRKKMERNGDRRYDDRDRRYDDRGRRIEDVVLGRRYDDERYEDDRNEDDDYKNKSKGKKKK